MRWRDPTIEPVTPHPDSRTEEPERARHLRLTRILGIVLALVLTANVAVMVALAFGSPDSRGPAAADVVARWNLEVPDPELRLASGTNLCGRDGATAADVVRVRGVCTAGVVNQIEVVVARSAGRSQEIHDVLVAMFGDPAQFDTSATGLTFDITIRSPRLTDPDDPTAADGAPLASASPNRFYERPALMYSAAMAILIIIHLAAFILRSRRWRVLLLVSLACWSAVLLADLQFLSRGRSLTALAALIVGSLIFNLIVLADQVHQPLPGWPGYVDARPRPPEIDLTLEPPPLSPRWGNRGERSDSAPSRPPRIL